VGHCSFFLVNTIDYIILGFVLFFTLKGLFKGFIQEVLGLVSLLVAFTFATKYMSTAAYWIDSILNVPPSLSTILGFISVFFLIILILQITSHFLQKIIKYSFLGWLEKLLGGIVGFLKGAIIVSLVAIMVSAIPLHTTILPQLEESVLFTPSKKFAPALFDLIMHLVPRSKSFYDEIKETYEKLPSAQLGKYKKDFLKSMQDDKQSDKKRS